MNEVEALYKMRTIIEKGWCQRALARDRDENVVSAYDEKATKFCLVGALSVAIRYNFDLRASIKARLTKIVQERWDCKELVIFNDNLFTRHEEVLELMDRAVWEAMEENC